MDFIIKKTPPNFLVVFVFYLSKLRIKEDIISTAFYIVTIIYSELYMPRLCRGSFSYGDICRLYSRL